MKLNENFWDNRYQNKDTGWDLGAISTPLQTYFNQLSDKTLKIIIPGGGNSYEAAYLHALGFTNVYVIDLSETALTNIKKRIPSFPEKHLIHGDFFTLKQKFDLLIEQTFFCAINKNLRSNYAQKAHQLLTENGKIVGLLFNEPLYENHPPFGGSKEEYISYFKPFFKIEIMENCYNSVKSRKNRELFIKMSKR